ncbi:hypothetical protein ACEN88_35445, partial [Massilia sp. CT11-108]
RHGAAGRVRGRVQPAPLGRRGGRGRIAVSVEGPDLESLVRRLAGTPPEFTDEPRIGGSGRVAGGGFLKKTAPPGRGGRGGGGGGGG